MKKTLMKCAFAQALVWMLATGSGQAYPGIGSGSPEDPYQISTISQLQAVAEDLSAHYAIMENIDAMETAGWNDGAGFMPVGSLAQPFAGTLDGRGHAITGLRISKRYREYVGLFGAIATGGLLQNVTLDDARVDEYHYVGILVGRNDGNVRNCYVRGVVTGHGTFGGLVGWNVGLIEHCAADVHVSHGNHLGGLAGINMGVIRNSFAIGNVVGHENPGGLVGVNTGLIEDCYALGSVKTSFRFFSGYHFRGAGGLVGQNHSYLGSKAVIRNAFASGAVSGPDSRILGGLVGTNTPYEDEANPQIVNCFYNDTAYNPSVGVGMDIAGGIVDITAIPDDESHFFDNANPPLDVWDFVSIWAFPEDMTGIGYPEFRYPFPDTTAPVIESISATPNVLWPPNRKMVAVVVQVTATDDMDPAPVSVISEVEVIEGGFKRNRAAPAADAVGLIDGLTVYLRAARAGSGTSREYVIHVVCSDAHGNETTGTISVMVPHDMRKTR